MKEKNYSVLQHMIFLRIVQGILLEKLSFDHQNESQGKEIGYMAIRLADYGG
jgi:hypothetical protein